MIRKGYRVRGHVQGVGFRWWTRSEATRLGLAGTVRNRSDGTVEVQLAGPEDAIAELRRRFDSGPASAHVTAVEEIAAADEVPVARFTILH